MDKKIIKFDGTEIDEYEFYQYKNLISIINIDINAIVVSKKFTLGKQDFKYFIGNKDNKEIMHLCMFPPGMKVYERYSDKIKCMYFTIKDEKNIEKYMTTWEKVSNMIKRNFNSELSKIQRFNTKENFQCFYVPVILFDSVCRKDGNCYLKVFLEKLNHNFFWRSIINFGFCGIESSS